MRLRRRDTRDSEKGQAAIELLMIFPVFIIIVLLSIDFGLWMYQFVSVSNAVREGARYGAVDCAADGPCTEALVKTKVIDRSSGVLEAADCIEIGWEDESVVVTVKRDHNLLFVPSVTVPVVSSADMRLEKAIPSGAPSPGTCP